MMLRAAVLAFAAAAILVPVAGRAQSPVPAATPAFIGPTPDPSGTACPGEDSSERKVSGPQKITIPPESAAYFKAHNGRSYAIVVLAIRLDGHAAINFPANQDLDAPLRAALLSFAQTLTIVPAIPGCARPGAIVLAHIDIPDGDVSFTMQMVPPTPPPRAPGPLPSMKL